MTTAMKQVARGARQGQAIPFSMPYTGRENYHYVEDVGSHFAIATADPFEGCAAFNIRGQTIEVEEFLRAIATTANELGIGDFADLRMADNAAPNLFVSDLDETAVRAHFARAPRTSLETGIRNSLEFFRDDI